MNSQSTVARAFWRRREVWIILLILNGILAAIDLIRGSSSHSITLVLIFTELAAMLATTSLIQGIWLLEDMVRYQRLGFRRWLAAHLPLTALYLTVFYGSYAIISWLILNVLRLDHPTVVQWPNQSGFLNFSLNNLFFIWLIIGSYYGIDAYLTTRELRTSPSHGRPATDDGDLSNHGFLRRIVVKSAEKVLFLDVGEVDFIEAANNYVRVTAGNKTYLLREKIGLLEKKLDPKRFARIHRSSIINIDQIESLEPLFHGDHVVKLKNGKSLRLSRTFKHVIEEKLGQRI